MTYQGACSPCLFCMLCQSYAWGLSSGRLVESESLGHDPLDGEEIYEHGVYRRVSFGVDNGDVSRLKFVEGRLNPRATQDRSCVGWDSRYLLFHLGQAHLLLCDVPTSAI